MHRAVVVGLLLACVVVGSVVATATPRETATANTTAVRHVDPAEAESEGDLDALESYLQRQLAARLTRSQIQVSRGEYRQGKSLVDEEYRDLLAKYVDVEGETGGRDESQTFRETGRDQRDFADDVRGYRETLEEYREAKRAGDERRARRLARELETRSEDVAATGRNLSTSYRRLGNATGGNFSDTRASVNATVANVTAQQSEIRAAEFIRTQLTATVESEAISFYEPLVVEGYLETENGTALAERTVTLRAGNRSVTATTDEAGRFTITYRPVRLPLATERLRLRYRPANESVYLGSTANVSVGVEQVTPELRIAAATDSAAFRERVATSSQVTVDDEPVRGAAVGLFLGGRRLATGRTDQDGEVVLSAPLPAEVATGERRMAVRVLGRNRSIGPATTSRTLYVRETDTDLSVTAGQAGDAVRLNGRLTTVDGEPVPGRSVAIRRNDSLVTTVRTGPDGGYTATVPAEPGHTYRLAAVYDEPSTNLGPSRARTSLTLPRPSDAAADESEQALSEVLDEYPALVAGGLLLGLLLVAGAIWLRRGGTAAEHTDATLAASDAGSPETTDATTDPLSPARAVLDENANAAVERAYRAVRSRLRDRGIGSADATHWELYRAGRDAGVDATDLETLTTAYERAAFDPREIDRADARTALAAAEQLT